MREMWGVSSGVYSDYSVLCLTPTKADAERLVGRLARESEGWHRDARVERFLVCDGGVEQVTSLHFRTTLWDDGSETDRSDDTRTEWPWEAGDDACAWRWVRAPMHQDKGGRLEVWGLDHERVKRTFSDKRAAFMTDLALRSQCEAKGKSRPRAATSSSGEGEK